MTVEICEDTLAQSCHNGGYQDPKNCSRCRCPDGLGGTYCQNVAPSSGNTINRPTSSFVLLPNVTATCDCLPEGCGGILYLTSDPMTIESPGYSVPGYYNDFTSCSWLILAPVGRSIKLSFTDKFYMFCNEQTVCLHWVEVKYKENLEEAGPRYQLLILGQSSFNIQLSRLQVGGNEL